MFQQIVIKLLIKSTFLIRNHCKLNSAFKLTFVHVLAPSQIELQYSVVLKA